ncbi:MAG: glycosyltransferase family 2 protein [Chthoniobacteraceae bacterium]
MRLSIVTPTLNRAHFLAQAIQSVLAQNDPDVEHIVVDGMSTDGSAELLARHPHLRVIREPDTGLYDALNKGLRAATGDFIGWLNSDDVFTPDTFRRVREAAADPAIEAVYGRAEIFVEGGGVAVPARLAAALRLCERSVALTFENVTMGAPNPNARFFRRSVYDRVGFCDLRYQVAADRDFLLRVAMVNPPPAILDETVYRYRWHDESLTFADDPTGGAKVRDEYLAIAEEFLARPDLSGDSREALRRWHQQESAASATCLALGREWRRCGSYAARGMRTNPAWPLMFLRHLGGALLGR